MTGIEARGLHLQPDGKGKSAYRTVLPLPPAERLMKSRRYKENAKSSLLNLKGKQRREVERCRLSHRR